MEFFFIYVTSLSKKNVDLFEVRLFFSHLNNWPSRINFPAWSGVFNL
jgi:hypothetical protein